LWPTYNFNGGTGDNYITDTLTWIAAYGPLPTNIQTIQNHYHVEDDSKSWVCKETGYYSFEIDFDYWDTGLEFDNLIMTFDWPIIPGDHEGWIIYDFKSIIRNNGVVIDPYIENIYSMWNWFHVPIKFLSRSEHVNYISRPFFIEKGDVISFEAGLEIEAYAEAVLVDFQKVINRCYGQPNWIKIYHESGPPCSALNVGPASFSYDFGERFRGEHNWFFDVFNEGNDLLTWTISTDCDWITVSPSSGSSTGEHIRHDVTIDLTNLSLGSHNGHITINSNFPPYVKTGLIQVELINTPPFPPYSWTPANSSTDVDINPTLNWEVCGDPDGDSVVYDVYFGINPNPTDDPPVSTNQVNSYYGPLNLQYGTTYYWQIVCIDTHGAITKGPILQFITMTDNQPPIADAGGPYSGVVNNPITFDGSNSYDTDGNIIGYRWDWTNDGTWDTIWLSYPTKAHTYSSSGTYTVALEIKDDDGATSEDTASVTVIQQNQPPEVYMHAWRGLIKIGWTGPNPNWYKELNGIKNTYYTFKAYGLGGNTNDPDGTIIAYKWERETDGTCFLGGTKIAMANGITKNIEDIEIGELIKTYDEENDIVTTGKVVSIHHHNPDEMTDYYLIINDKIRITPNHIIYVNKKWKSAGETQIGDHLQNLKGESVTVKSIIKVYNKESTYNLEVEKHHNYYAENILVHNGKSQPDYPWIYSSTILDKTWSWANVGDYEVTLSVKDNDYAIRSATILMQISNDDSNPYYY
jgi:hypothetical protein